MFRQHHRPWVMAAAMALATAVLPAQADYAVRIDPSDRRGAAATQWECQGSNNQQWRATPVGTDVQLRSVNSGLCLASEGGSPVWGARIVQQTCNGSANQTWR